MQVGIAAHCECCHDLKWTVLTAEIRHDRIQVDVYKYIDVCAVTKYLLDAHKSWGLHLSQEAQCTVCILSYIVGLSINRY